MGHKKTTDIAQSHPTEATSTAPSEALITEPHKPTDNASMEQTTAPADASDPVKPSSDIVLPANSVPVAEARKDTSDVDMPMATPTPLKPILKFKPSRTKPKADPPVALANGDANKELEALLSPDAESKAAPVKDAAADADLLLGELVDEIGVDTKRRGTPSWSSKRKGKDRADGQACRLVPESSPRQGSPAVPAMSPVKTISPVKPPPKRVSSLEITWLIPTPSMSNDATSSSDTSLTSKPFPKWVGSYSQLTQSRLVVQRESYQAFLFRDSS